jgi:hypothetical protein
MVQNRDADSAATAQLIGKAFGKTATAIKVRAGQG